MIFPLIIGLVLFLQIPSVNGQDGIDCQLAGNYFPKNPNSLTSLLNEFIDNAPIKVNPQNNIRGLIVSDAPLLHSGNVSAYAYKTIINKNYDLVIILGYSEKIKNSQVVLLNSSTFSTPLGMLPVAKSIAESLANEFPDVFKTGQYEFVGEQSIETQLPFIQHTLGAQLILPMIIPDNNIITQKTVEVISDLMGNKSILLITPVELKTGNKDTNSTKNDYSLISNIDKYNIIGMEKGIADGRYNLDGFSSLQIMMKAIRLKGNYKAKMLRYIDSKNLSLTNDTISGRYIAGVIYEGNLEDNSKQVHNSIDIHSEEILNYTWDYLKSLFGKGDISKYNVDEYPFLLKNQGLVIRLIQKGEKIGCGSHIEPDKPLIKNIQELVRAAAFADVSHSPLKVDELDSLTIEISLITSIRELPNPMFFKFNIEGLYLISPSSTGIILPQVASENGLSKEDFVRFACNKANLSSNCYLNSDVKFYAFKVRVYKR